MATENIFTKYEKLNSCLLYTSCPQADSKGKVPLFIGGNSRYSVQGAIEAH